MVGYVLRFARWFRAVQGVLDDETIGIPLMVRAEVGQYLPDWRPNTDYRQSVSARSDLGGGALLELSHEIDFVQALVGQVDSVAALCKQSGQLELDVEDIAEINLHFRSGCVGNVHLDMLQRQPVRGGRVVGSEGTVVWDGLASEVDLFKAGAAHSQSVYRGSPQDGRDMYVEEIVHFLDCIRTGAEPDVDGVDGLRALKVVQAARISAREGRMVRI